MVAVDQIKKQVTSNRSAHLGVYILDLSKTLVHDIILVGMAYDICIKRKNKEMFEFSEYSKDSTY